MTMPERPAAVRASASWNAGTGRWEDGEFWYDERTADRAAAFFPEYLVFTDGEWAGKPFTLQPWQEHDIIRPMFGWKRADGTRQYRRAIVFVPRKNGKTELAAGVSLLCLIGDAEPGGQVYSIAHDEQQARLVFNKATAMVNRSPKLAGLLETYKTSIYCAELNAGFKPLSGRPTGKHGLSMSGLIGDEIHEWKSADLYTFVHQSVGARRQPLEFLISTAGQRIGFGWETWEYCLKVRDGVIDDPETLVVIYAAPEGADWTDEATWRAANPNCGVSPKIEYLRAECQRAQQSPREENDFKRYHLNIWTEQAVRWLQMERWRKLVGDTPWQEMAATNAGRRCFGAVDLAATTDLAASVLVFPPDEEVSVWRFLPRFFVPSEAIANRVRRDRVPYDKWARSGALIATEGNVVDYDFIKAQILADAETFQIQRFGFDPFNATQIMIQLAGEGLPVEKVRQGFLTLSAPSKELERLLLSEQFEHGGHPILEWCAGNVSLEADAAGNIKPSKAKSTERIDGIAALVSAMALALGEAAAPETSFWEELGAA